MVTPRLHVVRCSPHFTATSIICIAPFFFLVSSNTPLFFVSTEPCVHQLVIVLFSLLSQYYVFFALARKTSAMNCAFLFVSRSIPACRV